MQKTSRFTLIELLVIMTHLCGNFVRYILKTDNIKRNFLSPAHGQVKQYCFTLIELLVVIAIIAILAAMLLPALGRVKDTSKIATCSGNIKQLAMGIISYGNDHKDFILLKESGATSSSERTDKDMMGPDYKSWNMFIAPYIGINLDHVNIEVTAYRNSMVPEVYMKGIMKCPASTKLVSAFTYVQYGMPKYNVGGEPYTALPAIRTFSQAKMPGQMALLLDAAQNAIKLADGYDTTTPDTPGMYAVEPHGKDISRRRHNGRTNIAMLDGHVETITEKVLQQKLIPSTTYANLANNVLVGFKGNKN